MANAQGIDVYQGTGVVDWPQVFSSGRVFTWLKAAEGKTLRDSQYKTNYANSGASGFLRGAYIYAWPQNDTPQEHLDNLLAAIGNDKLEMGIALDLEQPATQAWVDEFGQLALAKFGRKTVGYSYPSYLAKYGIVFKPEYYDAKWIADYGVSRLPVNDWTFWQDSSTGHVPGVIGDCDLDEFNGTLEQLKEWAGIVEEVKILVNGKEFATNGVMYKGNTMVPWTVLRDFAKDVKAEKADASKYGTPYAYDFVGEPDGTTVTEKPVKADVTLTYADGSTQTL